MLDENFQQLQSMEEDGSAALGYVADIINLFINNTNRILNDIAGLLSAPNPSSLPLLQLSRLARSGTHPSCLLCFAIHRSQPVVDYDMVDVLVRQLKGSSYRYNDDKPFLSLPIFNYICDCFCVASISCDSNVFLTGMPFVISALSCSHK